MSNYDKTVKLACKPKNAPPKAKYVDTLIAATFSDDGSMNDIIRSLSLRLREPNAVVVFKALLVVHQMMRSGSTDQLLQNLAQNDVLRLRNISGQNWEGYSPPANMGAYARYLDTRIKAYANLRHDLVRAQTESNRRSDGLGAASKARRLRHLPVEKGLLREVKAVQDVLSSLAECKFYEDNLQDENTVLAFRMLVKDLLVLFQAGNEGVCNILEHYFEMSKVDAKESFDIYKSFIKQTDRVVDYLGVARKLHNVVNVPVPNLKHAPTSLVKALEEYLNDPNFENNRMEYKRSLGVVEGKTAERSPSPSKPADSTPSQPPPGSSASTSAAPPSQPAPTAPSAPPGASQKIQDFFDSIQADQQPTMFGGPSTNGFPNQQMQMAMQMQMQQAAFNPFRQSMMMPQQTGFMQQPQMSGFPMAHPQQQGMEFVQPQATGAMAFGNRTSMFQTPQQSFPQQPFVQQQQTGFMQPQPTQGLLQPQQTGSNPFRQSMMIDTSAGHGPSGALSQPSSPLGAPQASFASQIRRPGSTPAMPMSDAKPLTAQTTGSKNPFAPAGGVPQPKVESKALSMAEMAFGRMQQQQTGFAGSGFGGLPSGNPSASGMGGTSSPWGSVNGQGLGPTSPSGGLGGGSGMSDIASAFSMDNKTGSSNSDFMSQFGSLNMSSNNTGATSPSFGSMSMGGANGTTSPSPISPSGTGGAFLQPQRTGFGGSAVKPFKPTSSFGSQLMSDLAPLPENGLSTSQGGGGGQAQQTGFPGAGGAFGIGGGFGGPASAMGAQGTGQPNPFRQSTMFGSGGGSGGAAPGAGGANGLGGMGGMSGMGSFGQGGGAGAFGANSPFAGQNRGLAGQQGQPQGGAGGSNQFGGMFGQQGQQQGQAGSLI